MLVGGLTQFAGHPATLRSSRHLRSACRMIFDAVEWDENNLDHDRQRSPRRRTSRHPAENAWEE